MWLCWLFCSAETLIVVILTKQHLILFPDFPQYFSLIVCMEVKLCIQEK